MNNSGRVLSYSPLKHYAANEIIVVCDTLDLPVGSIRIKRGGSSAGHNGLKSLIANLDESDFIRIYIGIGRPKRPVTVVEYVLARPSEESEVELLNSGIDSAAKALTDLIHGLSFEEVSRAYNRRVSP